MIQYIPPVRKPRIIIHDVLRYQGNSLVTGVAITAETAADADELDELLIIIGVGLSGPLRASTCFPHLGQTTQYMSITDPQNLQYFVSFI